MPAVPLWPPLQTTGAIADLTSGVRLLLHGPDAIRYLNGQVTNDVRKLTPGHVLPACITNHKGKLEAYIHLTLPPQLPSTQPLPAWLAPSPPPPQPLPPSAPHAPQPAGAEYHPENHEDSAAPEPFDPAAPAILISGPADLVDVLPLRLEKYLIADRCTLADITARSALLHLIAPASSDLITPHLLPDEHPVPHARFGPAGLDLWTTPDRIPFWLNRFPNLTADDLSTLEVLHAIPAWDHELTPGLLPPEAGLDATAIDYHKGCYIGQETISRIRSVGHVNRHLHLLQQTSGPPLPSGTPLHSADSPPDSPPAGTLTRSAAHPLTGEIHALAYLRRGTTGPLQSPAPPASPHTTFILGKTLDD